MHEAPATTAIAAVTIIVSMLVTLTGHGDLAAIVAGFVPGTVMTVVSAPPGVVLLPVWATPLTATLVHGGFIHLALNMVMLVYCGRMLERAIGSAGIAVLYVVGAYAAAAGQWAFDPGSLTPVIGASGAASALIAAFAMLFSERPVPAIGPFPSRVVRIAWLAAAWIGIQTLVGIATASSGQSVAIGEHIGGFAAGLALARPLLLWRYRHA